MHKLDDDTLITTDMLRACIGYSEEDGGNGQHYALLQRSNGEWVDHNPYSPALDAMQAVFARDVVSKANREIAHDGAWFIVFTQPGAMAHLMQTASEYGRFNLVWMDKDGDIRFRLEWEIGQDEDAIEFSDVLMQGWESWLSKCETAYLQWAVLTQATDAQSDQTFKKAQGQAAPTQH